MTKQISFPTALSAVIIVGLLIAGYVFGWVTPSQDPPEGDLDAPLDTSDTAQTKSGNLTINGTLTLGSQLISQVASGTAPFSIDSPTLVTNLNADKLDGYDAADLSAGGNNGTCSETLLNIRITSATYNGNLGGQSGGDDKCDSEYPGYHMCTGDELESYGLNGCLPNLTQYYYRPGWVWTGENNNRDCIGYTCSASNTCTVDSCTGGTYNCRGYSCPSSNYSTWIISSVGCNIHHPILCCK